MATDRTATLLAVNGGFVDTASFMALGGLFAAHVTGNFVTLGAALVNGDSGVIAKLLALPMFCAAILVSRLVDLALTRRKIPALPLLLVAQAALLAIGAGLAIRLGPFSNNDQLFAIVTGMVLVTAMAIQNAAHRIHLPQSPPSTIMTGTTTQIVLDAADLLSARNSELSAGAGSRLRRFTTSLLCFAIGCAAAAVAFYYAGALCFIVPPVIVLAAVASTSPITE